MQRDPSAASPLPLGAGTARTVAEFIDRALYDPNSGYYATRSRRSGSSGDFITSVDVGPLFGEMLAIQLAEMWQRMDLGGTLDLVEAGAGDGRLTRDILDALATDRPDLYERLHVTLVERSDAARRAAATTLHAHAARVEDIRAGLPERIRGVLLANELLDAMPIHVLVKTTNGLEELYLQQRGEEVTHVPGPLSDPGLAEGVEAGALPVGWRAERSLAVPDWIASAAASLERGFLLLVDYVRGCSPDTLLGYSGHATTTRWFARPGTRDISSHVDLDMVRRAAGACGLVECGCVDQTYFLTSLGIVDRLSAAPDKDSVARRLAAKTLILPGGLGSTMKVIGFSSRVDGTGLRGFSQGRLT